MKRIILTALCAIGILALVTSGYAAVNMINLGGTSPAEAKAPKAEVEKKVDDEKNRIAAGHTLTGPEQGVNLTDELTRIAGDAKISTFDFSAEFAETKGPELLNIVDNIVKPAGKIPVIIVSPDQELKTIPDIQKRIQSGEIQVVQVKPNSVAGKQFKEAFKKSGGIAVLENSLEQMRRALEKGEGLN